MTRSFVTKDGIQLAYYVDDFTPPWSTPETVVLLHAAMGSAERWFSWVPRLAQKYRVIRLDLRGHGQSQKITAEHNLSLDHLVSDVLELLDLLNTDSAHLVGNSAGGYVCQKLAINFPERVKTLALFGSTPGLKRSPALTWLPKIQEMGLKGFISKTIADRFDAQADPNLVAWFIEQTGSNDEQFIARFVSHMCTHDFLEELVAIKAPTLIAAAAGEQIGHASAYEEMAKRIQNSKIVEYETSGHAICDAYAAQCVSDLLDFYNATRESSSCK